MKTDCGCNTETVRHVHLALVIGIEENAHVLRVWVRGLLGTYMCTCIRARQRDVDMKRESYDQVRVDRLYGIYSPLSREARLTFLGGRTWGFGLAAPLRLRRRRITV